MAFTNKLKVTFNFPSIDRDFDFFLISTSEKYIARGAYVLDKPQSSLKASSLVFDNGKSAFVMFPKSIISSSSLAEQLGNELLSVKKIYSEDIKDYILVRLFLYALANFQFQDFAYNNITGKFFFHKPSWRSRSGNSIVALGIGVDSSLCATAEATTFTKLSFFKNNKKVLGPDYAKYVVLPNGKLRRILSIDESPDIYVKKGIPSHKAEIPFLDLRVDKVKETRAWYLHDTFAKLNSRFDGYLSVSFQTMPVSKTIGTRRAEDFIERSLFKAAKRPLAVVDMVHDPFYQEMLTDLAASLSDFSGIKAIASTEIVSGANNVVLIHDEDYYPEGKGDPHKTLPRSQSVQCVTIEESAKKIINDKKAVISTIFKELAIKSDIIDGSISLDDWASFSFSGDWVFGMEVDKAKFFMTIKPNGSISFVKQEGIYNEIDDPALLELIDLMDDSEAKGKSIVRDPLGNINLISRTSLFCMPNPELFCLETISRSGKARSDYLEGVVDINLFQDEGRTYYSAGLVGYGMNWGIPKASLLYEVQTIKGECIIRDLLETMSVMFVKYNSFTVMPYPFKYLREYIG